MPSRRSTYAPSGGSSFSGRHTAEITAVVSSSLGTRITPAPPAGYVMKGMMYGVIRT